MTGLEIFFVGLVMYWGGFLTAAILAENGEDKNKPGRM